MNDHNSFTLTRETGCGTIYITIIYENGKPHRVLGHLGKSGTCAKANISTVCELTTQIIQNLPLPKAAVCLTRASGNRCQYNIDSCVDILLKTVSDWIMTHNEQGEEDDDE